MNIYKLYTKPDELVGYAERVTVVPELAYDQAVNLGRRFPEGEAAIATESVCAYYYARDVIKKRFPAGEAAIATNSYYAYWYALYVIKKRFPAGEAAIAKNAGIKRKYEEYFGVKL